MGWEWFALIIFVSTLVAGVFNGRFLRGLINFVAVRTGGSVIPPTRPSTSFELTGKGSMIFEALKRALESSAGFKIKEVNHADGKLVLSTSVTMDSWGELVFVEVDQVEADRVVVIASSRPKMWGVNFDGGKNKKNLDKIEEIVKKQFNLA